MWWGDLEILLVAYSGLRWGEHVDLAAMVDRRLAQLDKDGSRAWTFHSPPHVFATLA